MLSELLERAALPGLLAQLVVSAALAGLCWTVQLSIYAHFNRLQGWGHARFRDYHADYMRSIGWVAGPLMVAEFGLAAAWLVISPGDWAARAGGVLVGLLWLHTFGVMVPLHKKLQAAPTTQQATRLCAWNWARTTLWTLRSGLLLGVLINSA